MAAASAEDLTALMHLEGAFPAGQRWSEDSWRDELSASNRHVLVHREDDNAVTSAATFAISDGVVDLHRIVTAPAAQRRGLASALVAAGLEWARERGASRVLLEVEATNTAALALYARQDFSPISERRDYYGPGAHAVVLERCLIEGEQS
ncbi:MAG: GNAT family N-acetyltransferase [Propionibacteriaceae bacterium]|nr:GNAT family N-acetyltransferase [Propionibacteriaceae bacterium]